SGGEAAMHRARVSTRGKSADVARRDASHTTPASETPQPLSESDAAFPRRAPSSPPPRGEGSLSPFPPPLRGRVREGGEPSSTAPEITPAPDPSPQGGGAKKERRGGSGEAQADEGL